MHECVKCKTLIKPASLEVVVAGEPHHPQCLSCSICERPLFGKGYKKDRKGKLQCEDGCVPKPQPQTQPQASNAQPKYDVESFRKVTNNSPMDFAAPPINGPTEMYRKTQMTAQDDLAYRMQASRLDNSHLNDKMCKLCNQSVIGRRFVTYENGDVICYDCDTRSAVRPPRIKSAHIIICSFCNNTVQGKRYITEPNGKILCDKCELNAPKCAKCNRPIALDENPKTLSNGAKFHQQCFTCNSCNSIINEPEFYENSSREPLCLNCFELTKLPKCLECKKPISGGYFMIDNRPIHKECFKCNQCNDPISPEGGYFKNSITNMPVCSKCNLLNTAPKCAKCGKIVEKDGCTFSDRDYHQQCFLCTHCNVELVKMKKTYCGKTADEIMCEPCFTQIYAPKCGKCAQPISPHLPGTKYEDKMFHLECFACGRCKKNISK